MVLDNDRQKAGVTMMNPVCHQLYLTDMSKKNDKYGKFVNTVKRKLFLTQELCTQFVSVWPQTWLVLHYKYILAAKQIHDCSGYHI